MLLIIIIIIIIIITIIIKNIFYLNESLSLLRWRGDSKPRVSLRTAILRNSNQVSAVMLYCWWLSFFG